MEKQHRARRRFRQSLVRSVVTAWKAVTSATLVRWRIQGGRR